MVTSFHALRVEGVCQGLGTMVHQGATTASSVVAQVSMCFHPTCRCGHLNTSCWALGSAL